MTRGVPGSLDHLHAADLIALCERPGNVVSWPGEHGGYRCEPGVRPGKQVRQPSCFDRSTISFATHQWNSEPLADGMTATLVIRMRVRDGMGGEFPILHKPQELPSREPATRVNEGVSAYVDVQYIGADQRHPPYVSSNLLDVHAWITATRRDVRSGPDPA